MRVVTVTSLYPKYSQLERWMHPERMTTPSPALSFPSCHVTHLFQQITVKHIKHTTHYKNSSVQS